MRSTAFCAVTATAVFLSFSSAATSQVGADMVISGKLNHTELLDLPGDADDTVALSAARYIFEVPPSRVGVIQPLDQDLVESLCRDVEGCRVTVQAVNWDAFNAPGGVMSKTSRLFLSETSTQFRFDDALLVLGEDGDEELEVFEMLDCKLTDGELDTGTNGYFDDAVGFALLNCNNGSNGCSLSDATTTCRVVIED